MTILRAANHAITGLHYQFDKSIITILESSDGIPVTLEGIEDIDLGQECIQCKYHATQKYTRSKIRSPLVEFLKHYSTTGGTHTYTLYAHFKDTSGFVPINLQELNLILADERAGLNLSDASLSDFLANNFRCVLANEYGHQLLQVRAAIVEALGCTEDECGMYFYKNALHEVIRLSRQAEPKDRTTTRQTFLRVINKKRLLYSIWLHQLAKQTDYIAYFRRELAAANALLSSMKRTLFLDRVLLDRMGVSGFIVLCQALLERYYKIGSTLKSAVPFTLVLDGPVQDTRPFKLALLDRGIPFNDGREDLAFQTWLFDSPPVINVATAGWRTIDKISAASYYMRLISLDTYNEFRVRIESPDTFISTGSSSSCPEPHPSCPRHIHISEIDSESVLVPILT